MSAPFDTSRPSPIAIVRQFFSRGQQSVVTAEGMSPSQGQAYIESELDQRLVALLTQDQPPHLVLVSGSAGFGKSALIARIESHHPGLFEDVVHDATHAHSPSETQAD